MPASVVLVLDDIPRADRISDELAAMGMEPVCCFSPGEAIAVVKTERPDAVVIDAAIDGSEDLVRWLGRAYKGTVCLVHEFEGEGSASAQRPRSEEVILGIDETEDVVARLMGALATKTPRVARTARP